MTYPHPHIVVTSPAPGHYAITGHKPAPIFIEDVGHVVPPMECYISPEIPDDLLLNILEEREKIRAMAPAAVEAPVFVETEEETEANEKTIDRRRTRHSK